MTEFRPKFRFFSQIRPISPGFEPICRELGHFAWIWAILLGFGPQRRRSPEDGAGGGRTYVGTDRFPLCSTELRPHSGLKPKKSKFRVPMAICCMCGTCSTLYEMAVAGEMKSTGRIQMHKDSHHALKASVTFPKWMGWGANAFGAFGAFGE